MENVTLPDPDIDELKKIVKRQGEVIDETNRMVHSMRRGQRMRSLGHALWWLFIIGSSVVAYYYALPYINKFLEAYANIQQQAHTAQTLQGQLLDWIRQFAPGATTTPAQ